MNSDYHEGILASRLWLVAAALIGSLQLSAAVFAQDGPNEEQTYFY